MRKEEALKTIEDPSNLNDKFEAAYFVLEHSPPISQDKMLMLYAYHKQAIHGNYIEKKGESSFSDYIQTFKNNAWSQVKGLTVDQAKQKYIDVTLKVIYEDYKD